MNSKIFTLCFVLFLCAVTGFSQKAFEVNVFVDADKNIYLEDQKLTLNQLSQANKTLIYKQPAVKYNRIVYNIYGDKNLRHGVIMDVNHRLIDAVQGLPSRTNKYLLEYKNINLDKAGWQEGIKFLDLDAVKD